MRRLKKWVRNEPGLKIISLIMAVILWFYIAGEITEGRAQGKTFLFRDVPVKIMGSLGSFGSTIIRLNPQKVDLEIGGTYEVLKNLSSDDIRAYIEVEHLSPGKYMLSLQVNLPAQTVLISGTQTIEVEIGVLDEQEAGGIKR